jgi:hypothetical protein
VALQLGVQGELLRSLVRQPDIDDIVKQRVDSVSVAEIGRLKHELRELWRPFSSEPESGPTALR